MYLKSYTSFLNGPLLKQPKGLSYQAHYELFGEKSIDAPSSIRLAQVFPCQMLKIF